MGWFFRFQPLNFQGVYHTFWAPNKIMGKTRSFVPGAASSWPPSVRSFPSQWRGQNRCFWVIFFGTWGVCRLVRVGILKNWRKNILQSLKLWINESNLQNNWKILEMWKCHPFKNQNGFMECRFYVMCVCSLRIIFTCIFEKIPSYWLAHKNPYNGLFYSLNNWVV